MISERDMTLAVDMKGERSVVGWLASEKLNGCRAFWDGRQFWTRGGHVIDAPEWFTRDLPGVPLDGEIHCGRGHGTGNNNSAFKVASNAVRRGGEWFGATDDGHALAFAVFDFPQSAGGWTQRMAEARKAVRGCVQAAAVRVTRITDIHHFTDYLTRLRRLGAEGGMFRNPETTGYETGRSENLLRFKFEI
jgi:DNA ligase-1